MLVNVQRYKNRIFKSFLFNLMPIEQTFLQVFELDVMSRKSDIAVIKNIQ